MLRLLIALAAAAMASGAVAAPLTPGGWGRLRVGMSEAEAVHRFGLTAPPDLSDDPRECQEWEAHPAIPGLVVMTRHGRVARISLYKGASIQTDRGLGVGAREAEVRKRYGPALRTTPHAYEAAPAHYLTAWDRRAGRGIRYETDDHGRVTAIHAGDRSIEYIEGCL
ncbi:MAG TPA: hypothetical protein VFH92_01985 [Phenylobacterium sp.]|nr:hypothetical protein [Phenylobacterium sp.]